MDRGNVEIIRHESPDEETIQRKSIKQLKPTENHFLLKEGENYASKSISRIFYSCNEMLLGIVFANNSSNIYLYKNIYLQELIELISAESTRKYWNDIIKLDRVEIREDYYDFLARYDLDDQIPAKPVEVVLANDDDDEDDHFEKDLPISKGKPSEPTVVTPSILPRRAYRLNNQ